MGVLKHRSFWLHILEGLICTAALLAVKMAFVEPTEFGERLRLTTYDYMQHRLAGATDSKALPVVVVDISSIPFVSTPDGKQVSSREELEKLLKALTKFRPKAIGIDIDFAPEEGREEGAGYQLLQDDPAFFDLCRQMSQTGGPKVFLGVKRRAGAARGDCLGAPKYQSLAASIIVPKDNQRALWRWTRSESSTRLPTLAAVVAKAAQPPDFQPPGILRWAVDIYRTRRPVGSMEAQEFFVDYGPIERFEHECIPAEDITRNNKKSAEQNPILRTLQGKVLLLGDVRDGSREDAFYVPDKNGLKSGVLLHACAANTLINSPLYGLTVPGRIALDVLLGLLVLLCVNLVYSGSSGSSNDEEKANRFQSTLTWVVVLAAFVVGVLMVNKTRVMWDDFPLVILGMLIDKPFERLITGGKKLATGKLRRKAGVPVPEPLRAVATPPKKKQSRRKKR